MGQTDTTSSSGTNKSSQLSVAKDVFLSHSGKQKNFVRQLYRDLTNLGVSCFFDEDRESLPVAEDFPPHIFEAVKTCKIAVLLLSKDFLQTKWPMLELSAFVEARNKTLTNANLTILPLFFQISPDALKNTKENEEKWTKLEICREKQDEWLKALAAIRLINGLPLGEDGDEVKFRDEIVKEIWHILRTPRYRVHGMQGEARMCKEVANLFKEVQPNKEGIRIAGLYGIAGHGKTTLGKAFCNSKLVDFEGRVCHLDFSRGEIENIDHALQYLTHWPQSRVQSPSKEQAKFELDRRVHRQRVLLVLDNITEESRDEVAYYLKQDWGENSWILLSTRSVELLAKHFNIDSQSCMRVPRLEEEEAIAILLQRTSQRDSRLGAKDRVFALRCAERCSFKETTCDNGRRALAFHPLALKAFGCFLKSKYGLKLSKWVDETGGMVFQPGDGLDEMLGKAFDVMRSEYRTIFMLLTVYMLPNMSPDKVKNWLAINCNEEISFIEKAVESLVNMAFIEEFTPEISIHDIYIEFAQRKANKMERWLWWKEKDDRNSIRQFIPKENEMFELAKLEQCMYRSINSRYLGKLIVLQLVAVQKMSELELGSMDSLRSITLRDCKNLETLNGLDKLLDLAWLQIVGVNPKFKLPELRRLEGLQSLEINFAGNKVIDQLGDLTHCSRLREINVCCPLLSEFPKLNGMMHLQKVEFSSCDEVKGPLDCRGCVELQTIVLNLCCQMAASPLLSGCKKLSKLVLLECLAVTVSPDVDVPYALKTLDLFISSEAASVPKNLESSCELDYLQLWNMGQLMKIPSFKKFSNLTVLRLGKCGIREPPDLTGCNRLEDVYFFMLRSLVRFPNFSSLRELKKLSLCNCIRVHDPPDIGGCYQLQVFHLLYNDDMKGLPNMDECAHLEEIKVSWHSKYEVVYHGIDTDSCQVDDDLEYCLEHFQDQKFGNIGDVSVPEALEKLQWLKGKTMLVKRYFRGLKLHYSLTAPYEDGESRVCSKSIIILGMIDDKVMPVPRSARDSQDADWFHTVQGYFAAKKYSAGASASPECMKVDGSLVHQPSPWYRVKMSKTWFSEVCHMDSPCFNGGAHSIYDLDFCGGNVFARRELSLLYLSQMPKRQLESVISEDKARYFSTTIVECQKALLVLNPEHSRDEMRQVIAIELRKMCPEESTSGADHRGISVGGRCFSDMDPLALNGFNQPLVTKYLSTMSISGSFAGCMWRESIVLARDVFIKYRDKLLKWVAETEGADDLFAVLYWLCIPDQAIKIVADSPADKWISIMNMERKLSDSIVKEIDQMTRMIQSLKNIPGWSESKSEEVWRIDSSLRHLKYINEGDINEGDEGRVAKKWKGYRAIKEEILEIATIVWKKEINKIKLKLLSDNIVNRLAINCNEEINNLKEALEDLCKNAFIEESEPQNRIRDLFKEFAQIKKKKSEELAVFLNIQGCISQLLPLSPRYPVLHMQGGFRMSQKVADLFNKVDPNEKGIRIAGLYGKSGLGKTTLTKDFCNQSLRNFYGKVCHLEFCGGNALQRLKLVLQYFTELPMPLIESVTSEEEAHYLFSTLVKGQRVLLVLDDISYQNINEVKYYLGADFGENSCILLSCRSVDVLEKHFNFYPRSCMRVPRLEEEEAIAILWEKKPSVASGFPAESRDFALKYAKKCSFEDDGGFFPFHPLALKVVGRWLFCKKSKHSSNWSSPLYQFVMRDGFEDGAGDGSNDVFVVLDKAFDCMEYQCRSIFIHLARHKPGNMSNEEAFKWLARSCKEEIKSITEAVDNLFESAFIEAIESEIRIHDLMKEFAQMTNKNKYDKFAFSNVEEYISHVDPLPLRYPVPPLQGEGRMCQEVEAFFNEVSPNEKGIRIAGLYGMSGQGKTMLAKAFCNRSLRTFDGKVCYLEFCGVNKLKRLKLVLQYLIQMPMPRIGSVANEDEARGFFNTLVKGKNVFLVLDNISEESIDEVTYYLQAELGENSCILLIARSVDLLVKHFNIYSRSCMRVPRLEEEEAIAILWERKPSVASGFPAESRDSALKCAEKCSFKRDTGSAAFHPLALKVCSRQLFLEQSTHFSIWAASCHPLDMGGDVSNNVFDMLDRAFDVIEDKRRSIFIHLARHKPPNMSTTEVFNWLAKTCNNEISYIEEAVKDLFESAFIEEMEPEIRIHELMKEFAQMTNKDEYAKPDKIVISSLLEPPSQRYHVPAIQGGTRMCQKVSDFFNAVLPNRKKIRIAGLYGLPGQGKTTLCKTFCNLNLKNFDGRVCHLEFCGGNKLDRQKLALEYLTHCSESQLESLTREDEKKLYKNVRGHRVLLVLDNITEDSIDEVKYYLDAKLGENSCVLLSTRSEDVLKKLNVNLKSRMSVPGLQEEEAIAILLEKVFPGEPTLEAEDRGFALKCAEICLFKETCCDNVPRAPTFHPLALKAFGRYLFSKYRSDLSKWAAEIDGMEDRADDGLKDMFIVLDKAFDCMCPINRAIFMLLTLYMLPSISPLNVNEWLAITCKKNIESIEEAVGDLRKKSFIEETEPEIRIHNVYMEFALSRARKLKRWLWFEGNLVTSEAKGELELADVEYNQHLDLSKIEISAECGLKNLWALEVVNENKEMSNLGISLMKCIRSFPSQISEYLAVLRGMENLPYLASLQVGKLPDLKTLNLRRLHALQYLEIAIGDSSWPTELGDLTVCVSLREIYVCCRSLSKFPLIHGLECLEKANFKGCDEVFGQLDCSGCVKLRSVVFEHCSQMAYIPLIADCSNLSKIVLNRCDPITEYSDENESYGLEISELCISSEDASAPRHSECCDGFKNLPLWNIVISSDVPSLRRLSNLTVLKLYKCDISEPPDVTYCSMLEDVYFSRLRCLQRFPNFSSLGKLKKLCLCNCTGVQYPPAIKGCQGLQVFHLIYNDNMESLPQMNGFPILEEIKLSWQLEEENRESCSDEDEELDDSHDDLDDSHDNLEICPNYQQDEIFRNLNDVFMPEELKKWQWIQDKTVRVKKYSRGLKKYYCMTAPYGGSGAREEASNGNTLEQFTIPTASTICG